VVVGGEKLEKHIFLNPQKTPKTKKQNVHSDHNNPVLVPKYPGCGTKACESGCAEAQYQLSKGYLSGLYGLAVDVAKGVGYLRAASKLGNAEAQDFLGSKGCNRCMQLTLSLKAPGCNPCTT
jgi:hypothetical protein